MVGSFLLEYALNIVALVFMLTCPVEILSITSSYSSQFYVTKPESPILSEVSSTLNSSADGSLFNIEKTANLFKLTTKSVHSHKPKFIYSSYSSEHLRLSSDKRTGTFGLRSSGNNGGTSPADSVRSILINTTDKTVLEHALKSLENTVTSPAVVERLTSPGILTSSTSSLEPSASLLHREPDITAFPQASTFDQFSSFTMKGQSSSGSSPPKVEIPSSFGIIASPISSTETSGSLSHRQQNVSAFSQASAFQAFSTFTVTGRSLSGGSPPMLELPSSSGIITSPILLTGPSASLLNRERNVSAFFRASTFEQIFFERSVSASSPSIKKIPSSFEIISSSISSTGLKASSVHRLQNASVFFQASTRKAFSSFTKKVQSSIGARSSITMNYHNVSLAETLMTKTHSQAGVVTVHVHVVSSSIENPHLLLSQTSETTARNNLSLATALSTTVYLTKEHTIATPKSNLSNYGRSTTDKYISRTYAHAAAVTLNSSYMQRKSNENIVSPTNSGTLLKSSMAGTIQSLKHYESVTFSVSTTEKQYTYFTRTSQGIQKSVRAQETLSTTNIRSVHGTTRSTQYYSDEQLAHTRSPTTEKLLGKSSARQNVNKTSATYIVSLRTSLTSIPITGQHRSSTTKIFQSHAQSKADVNSSFVVRTNSTISLSHIPSKHSSLDGFRSIHPESPSRVPTIERSWTETVIRNSNLSLTRVFLSPTLQVPEASRGISQRYDLETSKSMKSFLVTSNAERSSQTSVEIQTTTSASSIMSISDGPSAVRDSGAFSTSSRTRESKHVVSSIETPALSFLYRSVSSYEIKLVTSPLVGKSSATETKESSDDIVNHDFMVSSSLGSSSELTLNDVISTATTAIVNPTPASSPVYSSFPHRSSVGTNHRPTSKTATLKPSKKSSSVIDSSEIVSISIIPILTPCYISYVITIAQRLVVESYSSESSPHNISTTSWLHGTAQQTMLGNSSFNLILEPISSTASLVPHVTMPTFSNTEYHSVMKPSPTILGQSQTNSVLTPTSVQHRISMSHGTAFQSTSENNSANWMLVPTHYMTSAVLDFTVETSIIHVGNKPSQTTPSFIRTESLTSVILEPTPTLARSNTHSSFVTSVNTGKVTALLTPAESDKNLTTLRLELTSTFSFPLPTTEAWTISRNWSQTELPVTRYHQRMSTSTLVPTRGITRNIPYSPTIESSAVASQPRGVLATSDASVPNNSFSQSVYYISISSQYNNSIQVTTTSPTEEDLSQSYEVRSIVRATSVLPSVSLFTITRPSSSMSLKVDTSSMQSATLMPPTSVDVKGTPTYINASSHVPYHIKEKSTSLLSSRPKTIMPTRNATSAVRAIGSNLDVKTTNITSTTVNGHHIVSIDLGKGSKSRTAGNSSIKGFSIVSPTPLIYDAFSTSDAKMMSGTATPSVISSLSSLLEKVRKDQGIKSSISLPLSLFPASITVVSSPSRSATYQYTSIEFGISQHSLTAKISPTPSLHVSKSVSKATHGFSKIDLSSRRISAVINVNATASTIKEVFPSRAIALTSTSLQVKSKTVATLSFNNFSTEKNCTSPIPSLPLSPVASMSSLWTASTSSHAVVVVATQLAASHYNTYFAYPSVHHSRSRTFTGLGSEVVAVVTTINVSIPSLPSSTTAQSTSPLSIAGSSSITILVLDHSSDILVPSLSETSSPISTFPARRKRRDVPNFSVPSNESSRTGNVSDKFVSPTANTVEPSKAVLFPSGVLTTTTENHLSSSASNYSDLRMKNSMSVKPSSVIAQEGKSQAFLEKTPSLGISARKASGYLSSTRLFREGENVETPIFRSSFFFNSTYVVPSSSDLPSQVHLSSDSFGYSLSTVSPFVTTSISSPTRNFSEIVAVNKSLSLTHLTSSDLSLKTNSTYAYSNLNKSSYRQLPPFETLGTILGNTSTSSGIGVYSNTKTLKNTSVIEINLMPSSFAINITKTVNLVDVASISLTKYLPIETTRASSSSIRVLASVDFYSGSKVSKDIPVGNGNIKIHTESNNPSPYVTETNSSSPTFPSIVYKQHDVTSKARGFLSSFAVASNNLRSVDLKSSPVLQTSYSYFLHSYSPKRIADSAIGIPTFSNSVQYHLSRQGIREMQTMNIEPSLAPRSDILNNTVKTTPFVFSNSEAIMPSPSVSMNTKLPSLENASQSSFLSYLSRLESLESSYRTIMLKSYPPLPKSSLAKNFSHEVSSFGKGNSVSVVTTVDVHSTRSTHFEATGTLLSGNAKTDISTASRKIALVTSSDSVQSHLSRQDVRETHTVNNEMSFVSTLKTVKTSAFVFSYSEAIMPSPSVSLIPKSPSLGNTSRLFLSYFSELESTESSFPSVDRTVTSKSYPPLPKSSLANISSHEISSYAKEATMSIVTAVNVYPAKSTHIETNRTSFPGKEMTDYVTVSMKIVTIAPSPSSSLTSAKKEKLMSTLSSSVVGEISSLVIKEKSHSPELSSSFAETLILNSLKHSEYKWTGNSSIVGANVMISSSLFTTTKLAITDSTNSRTMGSSGSLFNFYVFSTSTLGSCIAGYSTLILPIVRSFLSTTVLFNRRNSSSSNVGELSSPVFFMNSTQTSSIIILTNESPTADNTTRIPARSLSSTLKLSDTSWISSNGMTEMASSFVTGLSTSQLLAKPGTLHLSDRHSSVVSGLVTSTVINYFSTSSRNLSTTFPTSSTDHPTSALTSSGVLTVLPSPTLLQASSSTSTGISASIPGLSSVRRIAPSSSLLRLSLLASSSLVSTSTPTSPPVEIENSLLLIVLAVPVDENVMTKEFKVKLEVNLNNVYQNGRKVEARRRKRNTPGITYVEVTTVRRTSGTNVYVKFLVIDNNKTMPAVDVARTMNVFSVAKLSSFIGYDVLSRPEPASKSIPTDHTVAMLIQTSSSTPFVKKSLEEKLASFYNSSRTGIPGQIVRANVTQTYFEPLRRTYLEFYITVNNVVVNRTTVQQVFSVATNILTARLRQVVLVAPYIPGRFYPTDKDYIIQNMLLQGVNNFETIKDNLSRRLSEVYLTAKQRVSRKRKRRAIGSIDSVITEITRTQDFSADVTYYVIDGGSILNATYACAIINRMSTTEMSNITTPFIVSSTPRPVHPSPTETSDDGYPSWMIPVILAGSVGLLLLIIIVILYCRWKKGAPSKKVQPGVKSPRAEQQQRVRVTHAADPDERRDLRRELPAIRTTVPSEGSGTRPSDRPPVRKLPVRENSMRKKVSSRESLITSQTTRLNPAFIEESGDESVTDLSVARSRRLRTKVHVVDEKETELPRKKDPPVSVQETFESEDESGTEASDGESMYTKDSVFTGNTDQHSAAALPTVAVMSDIRPPQQLQPPVRFRTSVHPEESLPPIDLKQTSLVGRVVDEEGPIQQEMKSKADIERWRNKQRQREKKLGEKQSRRHKRPSFTEKKAWSRAQQEIGSVLEPEAMQPIVRNKKRKPRRKYNVKTETTDDEENVKLQGFRKLNSPREEKSVQRDQESHSDSDISMGEARQRMIALLDDAFSAMKSSSKKRSRENIDGVDGNPENQMSLNYPPSGYRPPLHPRPSSFVPALPEPPPAHGRATAPSARHRRRLLNSQASSPYPSHYYPGTSGRYNPAHPAQPPVVTKNPVVVWDPADKQKLLNQSSYKPYPGHPYTYSDPSGKLHFTPVHHTPDGMGGLVWSPYATEYAMEDFYRSTKMPGTMDDKNASFLSHMQETPLGAASDSKPGPRDTVIDMAGLGPANEPGSMTGESAEPLVRAIKDELFRLSTGRTPVKHL